MAEKRLNTLYEYFKWDFNKKIQIEELLLLRM